MKFNLPAPASVEWYRSGVPGGGQKDAIFNRVKAKLIGGTDDSGTSYFKLHDRQLSSSDADKIIANMKQDEDGYPMLQTGSTSGEAEREYQEWLIDRYLVSPPPSNTTTEDPGPKDVAVELQVVEIPAPPPESDKPEPLRVTVEAPFVAKKHIKLPRRRSAGIIYRGATKEVDTQEKVSTAQRMGEAFEKNLLGPLIKSIQDPDEDTAPAKKREKVRTLLSRKQRASAITVEKTPQGNSLAEFLGAKVGQSFKMAAQARRADKGLAKKPMFYLGKALTNQFGGDLVNRTKGYFSANPDDTQDPALSRSQRFAASIKPYMNEQGPLPPPVQGPQRSGIPGAFDKVAAKLDELIALKKKKAEQSKVANEIQQIEVKEATEEIKESNELKKKSVEIQKDFIAFTNEQKGDAKLLGAEDTAEERDPMADTAEVDNRRDDEEDEDDDFEDEVEDEEEAKEEDECQQKVQGKVESKKDASSQLSGRSLFIMDARPYLSSVANAFMGKGVEDTTGHDWELYFANMENIHRVRSAYVALGVEIGAVFSNNESTLNKFLNSNANSFENYHSLPLEQSYKSLIKSSIADMKNSGGRFGGAITAALLLEEFVNDIDWIHLDIAGPARSRSDNSIYPEGGTGFGVIGYFNFICNEIDN